MIPTSIHSTSCKMSDDRSPKQRREDLQKRADSAQESYRNGTLNGTPNGTPRGGATEVPRGGPSEVFEGREDDEQTDENVFLFVPNLIGRSRGEDECRCNTDKFFAQGTYVSSWPWPPSTSCPYTRDAAPFCTASHVSWTLWMGLQLGNLSRARASAPCWTW